MHAMDEGMNEGWDEDEGDIGVPVALGDCQPSTSALPPASLSPLSPSYLPPPYSAHSEPTPEPVTVPTLEPGILSSPLLNATIEDMRNAAFSTAETVFDRSDPRSWIDYPLQYEVGHAEGGYRHSTITAGQAYEAAATVVLNMPQARELVRNYKPSSKAKRGVRSFVNSFRGRCQEQTPFPSSSPVGSPCLESRSSSRSPRLSELVEPSQAKKARILYPKSSIVSSPKATQESAPMTSPRLPTSSRRRPHIQPPPRFKDANYDYSSSSASSPPDQPATPSPPPKRRPSAIQLRPMASSSPPPRKKRRPNAPPVVLPGTPSPPPQNGEPPAPPEEPTQAVDSYIASVLEGRRIRAAEKQYKYKNGKRRPMSEQLDEEWMVDDGLERLQGIVEPNTGGEIPVTSLLRKGNMVISKLRVEEQKQRAILQNLFNAQRSLYLRLCTDVNLIWHRRNRP